MKRVTSQSRKRGDSIFLETGKILGTNPEQAVPVSVSLSEDYSVFLIRIRGYGFKGRL